MDYKGNVLPQKNRYGTDFEIKHFYSTATNKTLFRFYETVFLIYKCINLERH